MTCSRADEVKRLAAAIQREIISCPNEQSFEGGHIAMWIHGCPTDVGDLLMNHEVPEELQEEVVGRLYCPSCDSPIEAWQEVGTKFSFEKAHEANVREALRSHEAELLEFHQHLRQYPMLGAQHVTGRRILRELRRSARMVLPTPFWFRARKTKEHGFGIAPRQRVADQRYNSCGQARWYFADSPESAVAEVSATSGGRNAWVAKFDLGRLEGLLDLRSWEADDDRALDDDGNYRSPHGLLLVALIAEEFFLAAPQEFFPGSEPVGFGVDDHEQRQWKPEYLIPRFVADSAQSVGFTGILYRSIRHIGTNLVVFDPEWTPRMAGDAFFLEIPESTDRWRIGIPPEPAL